MQADANGQGVVNILAADKLINSPKLYATFLLWMLTELFEKLPEAGDPDKPKLVFFFDEAHLLFTDLPKVIQDKVQQVVRLIRSKGVGIYFVTQNPIDVPDEVLGQLGNRVQHALRAFTPRDQKGRQGSGPDLPRQPQDQHRNHHYRVRRRRSPRVFPRRERHSQRRRARPRLPAPQPDRPHHS